jgi:hypothetical protein
MSLSFVSNTNFGGFSFLRFLVLIVTTLNTKNNITEYHNAGNSFTLQIFVEKKLRTGKELVSIRLLCITFGCNPKRILTFLWN